MIRRSWFIELRENLICLDDCRVPCFENCSEWQLEEHRHEEGDRVSKSNRTKSKIDLGELKLEHKVQTQDSRQLTIVTGDEKICVCWVPKKSNSTIG